MNSHPDRRAVLGGILCLPATASFAATRSTAEPTLRELIGDPLLRGMFSRSLGEFDQSGAAGLNRGGSFRFAEYQRQGAEWITRGLVTGKRGWILDGWRIIDYGLAQQGADGSLPGGDVQHSASLFLEAAARACLLDPSGATPERKDKLLRAGRWMIGPEMEDAAAKHSAPFTHRRYVMASMLGQIGEVVGDGDLTRRAAAWARAGIALQRPDGVNPERDGFDASYQSAGILFAERFLASCRDSALRAEIVGMMRRGVPPILARQRRDGSIDTVGSTRIGVETYRSGKVKEFNYEEGIQMLAYGSRLAGEPDWRDAAASFVHFNGWARS